MQCNGIKRNPTAHAPAVEQDIPAKSLRIQRDMVAFGWFAALEKSLHLTNGCHVERTFEVHVLIKSLYCPLTQILNA